MSRIGNRELTIPEGATVTVNGTTVVAKGPKGELSLTVKPLITVTVTDNKITTVRANEEKHTKQLHGTYNSLIQGMIEGVTTGFKKELEINGVGYRAKATGNKLDLSLGFSHPVVMEAPEGITVTTPSNTEIIVEGIDKQAVGQFASQIRA
jgi:large subunit ribosomal protein L6